MTRRPSPRAALPLLLLFVAGCACHHPERSFVRAAPGAAWVRTELMFGLSTRGGGTVNAAAWQAFLDAEITPRFPDGLTVLDGAGQWRNAAGQITREPAKILILLHPAGPEADGKIEAIRKAYKDQFAQESVLRGTSLEKVAF